MNLTIPPKDVPYKQLYVMAMVNVIRIVIPVNVMRDIQEFFVKLMFLIVKLVGVDIL